LSGGFIADADGQCVGKICGNNTDTPHTREPGVHIVRLSLIIIGLYTFFVLIVSILIRKKHKKPKNKEQKDIKPDFATYSKKKLPKFKEPSYENVPGHV
jgi:hypothetical protein